jgi:predicted nucleic acid-binding Zn finger protein
MIEILQEVTDWGKYPVANGVYHVNSAGQLVQHNDKVFKNPIKQFSKARRKFTKIGERPEELSSDVVIVKGSNGNTYTIEDGKCSCPGYTFRGNCKHVKEIS